MQTEYWNHELIRKIERQNMSETDQFIKEFNRSIQELFFNVYKNETEWNDAKIRFEAAEILAKDFEKNIRSYYLNWFILQLEQLKNSAEIIKDE